MKKVIRYAISFYTIICLLIGLISCKQINNEKSSESDQQLIYIGEDIAVAPTTYGKVRGFIMRDIYHFEVFHMVRQQKGEIDSCLLKSLNRGKYKTYSSFWCFCTTNNV